MNWQKLSIIYKLKWNVVDLGVSKANGCRPVALVEEEFEAMSDIKLRGKNIKTVFAPELGSAGINFPRVFFVSRWTIK